MLALREPTPPNVATAHRHEASGSAHAPQFPPVATPTPTARGLATEPKGKILWVKDVTAGCVNVAGTVEIPPQPPTDGTPIVVEIWAGAATTVEAQRHEDAATPQVPHKLAAPLEALH